MAKKLFYDADGNAYTKEQVDKMWADLPENVRRVGEALIAQKREQRQQQQQRDRQRARRRSGEEQATESLGVLNSFFQTFYGETYGEMKARKRKKRGR